MLDLLLVLGFGRPTTATATPTKFGSADLLTFRRLPFLGPWTRFAVCRVCVPSAGARVKSAIYVTSLSEIMSAAFFGVSLYFYQIFFCLCLCHFTWVLCFVFGSFCATVYFVPLELLFCRPLIWCHPLYARHRRAASARAPSAHISPISLTTETVRALGYTYQTVVREAKIARPDSAQCAIFGNGFCFVSPMIRFLVFALHFALITYCLRSICFSKVFRNVSVCVFFCLVFNSSRV